jgi:hypothetical protein
VLENYRNRVDPPLGLNRHSLDNRLRPPPMDDLPPGSERAVDLVPGPTTAVPPGRCCAPRPATG